jgi:hypothetical protein
MRSRSVKIVLKRAGMGLVGAAVLLGLCWGLYEAANYWRVERAIGRFETGPSQARADVLVKMIDNHVPTAKQGERILGLLLRPQIVTRETYPRGKYPRFALELPFAVRFRNVSIAREEEILRDGVPLRSHQGGGDDVIRSQTRLRVLYRSPRTPGMYHVEIRQRYAFNLHHVERTWQWRPLSGPFPRCLLPRRNTTTMPFRSFERWDYACSIAVEADVVIVEKSQAESIELISNPDLDAAMQGAFRSKALSMMTSWYQTPSGRRMATGALGITYHDLPAAVGFELVLRLEDGREIASNPQISHRLFARAGSSGEFTVSPSNLMLDEPETYTGSIVLRSDPNRAYEDPAIKTIWDGELEFPISFTVSGSSDNSH